MGGVKLLDAAGTEITLRSRKVRALIVYLALAGVPHGRDTLATLLWGDRLDAQALQSLRQALLTLRKGLGDSADSVVQSDDKRVALNTAEIRIDAIQFEELAHSGSLEAAAAIYDGDLADGLNDVSETFDDWLAAERLRLHELAGDVWTRLGEQRLQASNFDSAIDAGRRLVAMDPLREPGHRLLMSAYSAAGRRADALQHYATFAETLRDELDTAPDPQTQKLAERIRSDERPGDAEPVDWQPTAFPDPRPLVDRPSIAVLAFKNMSGDPEQEYFADGITDDIITALSKSRMFFVIARNSTFTYKGKNVDVRRIARELGVQYVLEGSVRREADYVRITAQLIDATSDKHVWAESYDRELADVFAVQDEITQNIAASVSPEYVSAEVRRARGKEARNLDAWDIYLRAYWHLSRFTKEDNEEVKRLCRQAIELDPRGAGHYGLSAIAHAMDALYGWGPSRGESLGAAREMAEAAVALDDRDARALRALGIVAMYERRSDEATYNFRKAIDLDPHEAENRALLGYTLGLAGEGRRV